MRFRFRIYRKSVGQSEDKTRSWALSTELQQPAPRCCCSRSASATRLYIGVACDRSSEQRLQIWRGGGGQGRRGSVTRPQYFFVVSLTANRARHHPQNEKTNKKQSKKTNFHSLPCNSLKRYDRDRHGRRALIALGKHVRHFYVCGGSCTSLSVVFLRVWYRSLHTPSARFARVTPTLIAQIAIFSFSME